MKIAIMGTGGLGGYFGGRLAHAGRDVTFIARSQREAMQENGLRVQSIDGDIVVKPVQVVADPTEVGPVEIILFCVKAYDAEQAATAIKPMVGEQTVVIPVLNGIDHIAVMQQILGQEVVLGGLTNMTAHVVAPGHIERVGNHGVFEFGELEGGISDRCEAVQEILAVTGVPIRAILNITDRMWWKLGLIASVNLFCVVRGPKGVVWLSPEARDLIHEAAAEAVAVAKAKGVELGDAFPDELLAMMNGFPPHFKPSMLVGLERGQPIEVEAINGALSRYGREFGVPTPIHRFIHACLKPYANGTPSID